MKMLPATFRPRLRPVETIVVPDKRHGRVLVLRDTQGITDSHAVLPPPLALVVTRFDGARTCAEIARDLSQEMGNKVSEDLVRDLASQLDAALFLDSPTFARALERVKKEFHEKAVRPSSHAGGAYPADPAELSRYIETQCLGRAQRNGSGERMLALVAPHIDPWRGAVGYGHAYGALASSLSEDADTFVLFGTSHAPMREPFALCRKGFQTPWGVMEADLDLVDRLAGACDFDPYADQLNHKREHSLEFQAVFLRHMLGDRKARIVPVLAGLGEHQANGTQPGADVRVARFLDEVRSIVSANLGKVVVVAGADLAHVGPRFGDPQPMNRAQRSDLAATDNESLSRALAVQADEFWEHVASDLESRRVCGLGPIFSLLDVLPEKTRGSLLHYEQTVDDEDGSIVSHAAVGFYR